jgi:hypothetical protein
LTTLHDLWQSCWLNLYKYVYCDQLFISCSSLSTLIYIRDEFVTINTRSSYGVVLCLHIVFVCYHVIVDLIFNFLVLFCFVFFFVCFCLFGFFAVFCFVFYFCFVFCNLYIRILPFRIFFFISALVRSKTLYFVTFSKLIVCTWCSHSFPP